MYALFVYPQWSPHLRILEAIIFLTANHEAHPRFTLLKEIGPVAVTRACSARRATDHLGLKLRLPQDAMIGRQE